MIFYFSATGNCKYVSERISKEVNEAVVSISDSYQKGIFSYEIKNNERVGFVTPTYFWGLPTIVYDFLEKLELKITGKPYIFHVATYGTTTGQIGKMMKEALEKRGFNLDGRFSVKMVDTWTPTFNLNNKDKINRINEVAEKEIDEVSTQIMRKLSGDNAHNKVPMVAVNLLYSTYKKMRKTEKFQLEDNCIGCGLCEKKCPVKAIVLQDGKPVWVKEECTLCLGCLHRCPKFSIQYGKNTKKHGQFTNPNVRI